MNHADMPFSLNGRVAIQHHGERSSAGVRWVHKVEEDEILLLAPLGQTVARLHRDATGVTLDESGRHYSAVDAETLTQQVLGWTLPLSGLRYWAMGLAQPDSAAEIVREPNGQISHLRQDGWEITYVRYVSADRDSLPLRLSLQRQALKILLLIDEWEKP